MNRVQKAIKDIYGDKVPDVKKNDTVKMAKAADSSPTKATSPVASPEKAAETPKDESVKETKKKDEKSDDDGDEVMSKGVLRTKFVEIKDAGNEEYKRKMWVMAIAKFGEGITLYQ